MSKIAENLLAIPRVDSGTEAMDRHCVDHCAIAQWIVDQMHLRICSQMRMMKLGCAPAVPALILADPIPV